MPAIRSAVLAAILLVGSIVAACGSPGATPAPTGPPAAAIVSAAGPLVGELGGYTWLDGGSDAPWLQGTQGAVAVADSLQFVLDRQVPIAEWSVAYAAAGQPSPDRLVPLATTGEPLEVPPPPPGRWTVVLRITFDDGLGDASYFWTLVVG